MVKMGILYCCLQEIAVTDKEFELFSNANSGNETKNIYHKLKMKIPTVSAYPRKWNVITAISVQCTNCHATRSVMY